MIRTIEDLRLRQLTAIAQISGTQLFFQEHLTNLAQAIDSGQDGQKELVPIRENLKVFIQNNNMLIQLLIDTGVMMPRVQEPEPTEVIPEVQLPLEAVKVIKKKPVFKILK